MRKSIMIKMFASFIICNMLYYGVKAIEKVYVYSGEKTENDQGDDRMFFISVNDFFEKTEGIILLDRDEEIDYARQMKEGSAIGREKLINGYLPCVCAHMKRLSEDLRTLDLVYRCCQTLEKAVDAFDFLQDSESFSHRLNWYLRQTVTEYIAERH